MDFSLTETQQLLKTTVERFVREHHNFEARKQLLASPDLRTKFWRGIADLGLLGVGLDEDFGGNGGGFQELAIIMEELGRGLVCEPYLTTVVAGAWLIGAAGSSEQKARLLPAIAEGRMKVAFAHGEPGTRYDVTQVAARAEPNAGGFRIGGHKSNVLGGDDADLLIVSARIPGQQGLSLFLIECPAAGISVKPQSNFDDMRSADVILDDVKVASPALLGKEGGAQPLIEHAIDRAAAALCWDAVGAMTALNEVTLDYIKTRVQFGRPIGKFQVLQHRMVDMTIAAEQARSMAILAADRVNSADAKARGKEISATKVAVGKAAKTVGQGAIQLHGGMGLTMEYIASHYFKRLTAFELMFGDTAYHLARFSA